MTTRQRQAPKDDTLPRSFRFSDEANDAIDEGARRFTGGNRTKWLEFLITASVGNGEKFIQTDEFEIKICAKKKASKVG